MSDEAQKAAYIKQAEEAWETAWKLFHDDSGWKVKEGKDLEHGKVFTKSQEPIGNIHKLEAYLESSVEKAAGMLFLCTDESRTNVKKWNDKMDKLERIEMIRDDVDVDYTAVTPPMKIVSKRDFVNVRHWKSRDGASMIVLQSATHPSKPPTDDVRATQKLGAMLVMPVDGNPNKCLFKWTWNVKFGGSVPQFMAEKALPGGMLKDLEVIQARVKEL